MATIVAAAGGGNWTTGSTWVGSVAPTAADDAQIPATAGNITIDSGAVCRSADFSTYTGTLTHSSGVTWTIGDGTAGLSNIALKLVSGMTYTLSNATTSAISFVSTSATVQTIDFASKNTGNVTFNATSNGSWQLTGTWGTSGVNASQTTTLTKGTLDLNGQTCNWGIHTNNSGSTRSLTGGSCTINIYGASATVWAMGTASGLTTSMASSTINFSGASPVTVMGSKTFGTVNFTGGGTANYGPGVSGGSISTLSYVGTASKTDTFIVSSSMTVTVALTVQGNSVTNRVLWNSGTVGTQVTITNTGVVPTFSNLDIRDMKLSSSYDASAITGKSGDCGGNSGITFTTAANQTWSGTSGGNWSANGWTSRVPLPQDNATISSAFSSSQNITFDMPRMGKTIDFTGTTGTSFTITPLGGSLGNTLYGSLTLVSAITWLNSNATIYFEGRSSFTLTSAGVTNNHYFTIQCPGGTLTMQDALVSQQIVVNNGTFDQNGFNATYLFVTCNSGLTRTWILGSGTTTCKCTFGFTTWALTSTALTLTTTGSTLALGIDNGSTAFTFAGAGLTYNIVKYDTASQTGRMTVTGANTFSTLTIGINRSIRLPASTTQTITTLNTTGTSGNLVTLDSSSAGTAATISIASGTVCEDYMSIKDSTATGGASFYAGANSTNVSGNTGWTFSACPGNTVVKDMVPCCGGIVPFKR